MEMHQIRYFLAVCETLNFTRAAEACNVTQPALSRAIQALEHEVGGLLFRRERNLTHLTDLGHLVRPHLEQTLHHAESAKSTARSFLKLEEAPLNLGVMCTIGPLRFTGFLAAFRASHPGIELSLVESMPLRLLEMLEAGTLDVAVMSRPETVSERVTVETLYSERFMVAFPPAHRFTQMNAVPVRELRDEPYLSRINCEFRDRLAQVCVDHGAPLKRVYRSEREDWIQTMVMAGLGVCFLPEFSPIYSGLQTRQVVDPEVMREVSLVTVSGRRFSPAVSQFIKAVRAHRWPEQSADLAPADSSAAAAFSARRMPSA